MGYFADYPQDKQEVQDSMTKNNLTSSQMLDKINQARNGTMTPDTQSFWQNFASQYRGLPDGLRNIDQSFLAGKGAVNTMNKFGQATNDIQDPAKLIHEYDTQNHEPGKSYAHIDSGLKASLLAKGMKDKVKELEAEGGGGADQSVLSQDARGVIDAVTGSVQAFGNTLGTMQAATPEFDASTGKKGPSATDTINQSAVAMAESKQRLTKILTNPKTSPQQKANIQKQLDQFDSISSGTADKALPSINKSGEQIYGEGLGVATDILGAGELPSIVTPVEGATDVGKTAFQAFKEGASAGAKTGAMIGGSQGGANALQNNADLGGVVKGVAAGGAMGGLTGGVLGGLSSLNAFNKLADTNPESIAANVREKILQTPESDLYKLPENQRAIYYQQKLNEASGISDTAQQTAAQRYTNIEEKIQSLQDATRAEGATKVQALETKNQALDQEVSRATIQEAQDLKPKLIDSMRENSATYRGLVEKEIEPIKEVVVSHDDLRQYINDRFADDPQRAADISQRLGLKGEGEGTIEDIYKKTKSLRQDISSSAKGGKKTFSVDDMRTNDAISSLSDFLKSQGVDLSEANKFWSQYAPLRDKLVKNIQPFTPQGAETGNFKTFTNTIRKTVEGGDPHNENFIAATENLLGEKIGNQETRDALSKLDQGQKEAMAAKVQADQQLAEFDTQLEKAAAERDAAIGEAKDADTKTKAEIRYRKDVDAIKAAKVQKTKDLIWGILKVGAGVTGLGTVVGGGKALLKNF